MSVTYISTFTGWGLLDEGFDLAGMECVAQVENNPDAIRHLEQLWPDVPRLGDIRVAGAGNLPRADVLAGGPPCQPFSRNGLRLGIDDERYLVPEFVRLLCELEPRIGFMENVPGLFDLVRDDDGSPVAPAPIEAVLGELAQIGWDAVWDCLPASAFGAFHERYRVFLLAYHPRERRTARRLLEECDQWRSSLQARRLHSLAVATRGAAPHQRLDGEPAVDRLVPRTAAGVAQVKGLGNGVHVGAARWWGERLVSALSA